MDGTPRMFRSNQMGMGVVRFNFYHRGLRTEARTVQEGINRVESPNFQTQCKEINRAREALKSLGSRILNEGEQGEEMTLK